MRTITLILLFTIPIFQSMGIEYEINARTISVHSENAERLFPLFSVSVNGETFFSDQLDPDFIEVSVKEFRHATGSICCEVRFKNLRNDTLEMSNFIPFGKNDDFVQITADGPPALARARLFRPGESPLNVTLPDNAWELGYTSIRHDEEISVCALARRTGAEDARKRRYKTLVYPGGTLSYTLYYETYRGPWQNGLVSMFRKKYLYDLEEFDNTLYEREDLAWIRSAYLIDLQFAWDQEYYDYPGDSSTIEEYLKSLKTFGNIDVYGIWPTWPRLGLDPRNQWDLYRDLPGGLKGLRELSTILSGQQTKLFIAYNPWDKSTREEDHLQGMASVLAATNADGVVLDTRGKSTAELQKTADSVKPGIVMYSEGMAVVKDMPGIISGRVHDAIYYQPVLNLNKLIRPDFAIFRVCQLADGYIHREVAVSFFNGYGTEINTFAPGRPEWKDDSYHFLGRTLKILRENSDAFTAFGYRPLIHSTTDSIWVNEWKTKNKRLFTILSFNPRGQSGGLFDILPRENTHLVDLWNHKEVRTEKKGDSLTVFLDIDPFPDKYTSTRREGRVACVAEFEEIIHYTHEHDSLFLRSGKGTHFLLWKGNPSYLKSPLELKVPDTAIKLYDCFRAYEGKVVIQRFDSNILIDEAIIVRREKIPILISAPETTSFRKKNVKHMKRVAGGPFRYYASGPNDFIPYPGNADSVVMQMKDFYIDTYPVTNEAYYEFISATAYMPEDTANYLRHWNGGKYREEEAAHPVVYVDYADALAYAEWAGKRLPTEAEWQYAAQGSNGNDWPWGADFDSTLCNYRSGQASPVDQFPEGKSPFGVQDLSGNVWQLTADLYDNGSYYFVMIRGGSWFYPTSSWWYIQGGPQPVNHRQMLLMVSPGFNRSATVGFRCVMDVN